MLARLVGRRIPRGLHPGAPQENPRSFCGYSVTLLPTHVACGALFGLPNACTSSRVADSKRRGTLGASQENPRSFLVYYVTWLPTRIMGGGLLRAIAQGVAVYYGGLLLGRACEPWNPIACSYWSHESLNCIACLYWSWF